MFVNCVVNQFAICLGVVVILLLNAMDIPCMVLQRMCVCDPSVRLDVPSIDFVYECVCRK